MSKRICRMMGLIACGFSFQFFGCQAQQVSQLLADGVKETAVEVSTFLVEAAVDGLLGLNN